MISNKKYIGNKISQKTYTDTQFNRHVNYGQKDQYAMADHHEAIISREVFEAANALVQQRGKEKGIIKGSFCNNDQQADLRTQHDPKAVSGSITEWM